MTELDCMIGNIAGISMFLFVAYACGTWQTIYQWTKSYVRDRQFESPKVPVCYWAGSPNEDLDTTLGVAIGGGVGFNMMGSLLLVIIMQEGWFVFAPLILLALLSYGALRVVRYFNRVNRAIGGVSKGAHTHSYDVGGLHPIEVPQPQL